VTAQGCRLRVARDWWEVRTQLVLAFLFLAVLPLAGIVFFSYSTSRWAFRQAVAAESTVLGEEMGERLHEVRELFAAAASGEPEEITTTLAPAAAAWSVDGSPADDMTLLVVRARE